MSGVGETETAEVLIPIVVDAVAVMGLIGHRLTGLYRHRHHAAAEAKRKADQQAAAVAEAETQRQARAKAEREQRRAKRTAANTTNTSSSNGRTAGGRAGEVAGDDPLLPPAERARAIAAANPEMTQAEIAGVVGRGERTVRRYLAETAAAAPDSDKGADNEPSGEPNNDNENDGTGMNGSGQEPGLVAV